MGDDDVHCKSSINTRLAGKFCRETAIETCRIVFLILHISHIYHVEFCLESCWKEQSKSLRISSKDQLFQFSIVYANQ